MTPTIIDPFLYWQFEDNQHVEIYGRYVDDLVQAGTKEKKAHSDATLER